jgi:NAD(P)-dependent dehydrogenase (short-subunit alcohol dehydrogenase family)
MPRGERAMVDRLKDKVALVVGAGSSGPGWGNGKATAVAFAREGAKVACADYRLEAAQETADLIQKEGGDAIAIRADAAKAADVAAMVNAAAEFFGRIDILDYNVGLAEVGGVVDISEAEWDRIFDVNLKGAMLSMKHVIPLMQKQGGGSIVNISSIAGIRYTGVDYPTYYATKAALNHLTRATAAQYAKENIRVNAILPGLMKTPMVEHSPALKAAYGAGDVEKMWAARAAQVPMGKMGDAWDVANAAVFLASDESRYITGIELVVDGGVTLKYA